METIIFRQLFDQDTNTFTYIIGDSITREAIIIDSVDEQVDHYVILLKELDLQLKYTLDTHVHADHITGSCKLKKKTWAQIVIGHENIWVKQNDLFISDQDILYIGSIQIKALSTPGHTNWCMSYIIENMVFTWDLLLIRGTGRTDFQSGSSIDMFESIQNKIYTLDDSMIIYPGHDYNGAQHSTVIEEKKHNKRISQTTTLEAFEQTMQALDLPYPKKIDASLPANMSSGNCK